MHQRQIYRHGPTEMLRLSQTRHNLTPSDEWTSYLRAVVSSTKVWTSPIRGVLHLHGRSQKALKSQIEVCRGSSAFWRNVLWSDEARMKPFVYNDQHCVWRTKGVKNTAPEVKHEGGSVMLWWGFTKKVTDILQKHEDLTKMEDYLETLKQVWPSYTTSAWRNEQAIPAKCREKLVQGCWTCFIQGQAIQRQRHQISAKCVDV